MANRLFIHGLRIREGSDAENDMARTNDNHLKNDGLGSLDVFLKDGWLVVRDHVATEVWYTIHKEEFLNAS